MCRKLRSIVSLLAFEIIFLVMYGTLILFNDPELFYRYYRFAYMVMKWIVAPWVADRRDVISHLASAGVFKQSITQSHFRASS